MRIKLIDSAFDKNTGVSYAKIQTDCGVFQAFSELHEEDKHISNQRISKICLFSFLI